MSFKITSSYTNTSIIDNLSAKGLYQNRLPGDVPILPYSFYDIKIKVNDLVTSFTINNSLEKIYNNWLYILSQSVMSSNNIPDIDYSTYMIADSGNGPEFMLQTNYSDVSGATAGNSLANINNLICVDNIINSVHVYNHIASTSTSVLLLSGFDTTNVDVISNSEYTNVASGIAFENIVDIGINSENDLIVLDSSLRSIYKFDITGILTLDTAVLNSSTPGRLLKEVTGSLGSVYDKTKFYNPISMALVDNMMYILDYNSSEDAGVVKVFDSNFNWKKNVNLSSHFEAYPPTYIEYNKESKNFYILSASSSTILQYTSNFELKNIYNLTDIETVGVDGETYKRIYFSEENKNIMYLVSSNNIYKKYANRPEKLIGKFLYSNKNIGSGNEADMNLTSMCIRPVTISTYNKDEIYVFEGNKQILYKFIEDSNYQRAINTTFDDKILQFSEIKIKPNENVHNITYNKTVSKLLYVHFLLIENLKAKFTTEYDEKGLSVYKGFNYITENDIDIENHKPTLDNYTGVNEILTSATINRCLEKIFKLQQQIINLIQEHSINTFPLTTQVISMDI